MSHPHLHTARSIRYLRAHMGAIQENRPELQLRNSPGPSTRASSRRPYRLLASVPVVPDELVDAAASLLRFRQLMRLLDGWLDAPLRPERDAGGHTVWMLDAVGYRVNKSEKSVYPVVRTSEGEKRGHFEVDLLNFLRTSAWIDHVIRVHGLADIGRQSSLFQSRETDEREAAWMSSNAYAFLLKDPRFRELARKRIPRALDLDPVLRALALAIRPIPERGGINSTEFTWTWRHERALRIVARENPRLLPFVAVAMREGCIARTGDPIATLRNLVLKSGLKAATWRFLVRNGVRWLRPVWGEMKKGERTRASIEALRVMEAAGYPPCPPQWFMRTWLLDCGLPKRGPAEIARALPAPVFAACCNAIRSRGSRHDPELARDLRLALEWGAVCQPSLDKLQRRAGWDWVRRHARDWDRKERIRAAGGPGRWTIHLPVYRSGAWVARAIGEASQLVDAALEFRNCAADYGKRCRDGEVHMFNIEARGSRKRLALAAITRLPDGNWGLKEIKGPRNSRVSDDLLHFAEGLAAAFRRDCPSRPEDSESPGSAPYRVDVPAVTCFLIDDPA